LFALLISHRHFAHRAVITLLLYEEVAAIVLLGEDRSHQRSVLRGYRVRLGTGNMRGPDRDQPTKSDAVVDFVIPQTDLMREVRKVTSPGYKETHHESTGIIFEYHLKAALCSMGGFTGGF